MRIISVPINPEIGVVDIRVTRHEVAIVIDRYELLLMRSILADHLSSHPYDLSSKDLGIELYAKLKEVL